MENNGAKHKWDRTSFLVQVKAALQPPILFPSLTAGLIMGIISATVSTAFASLIFSGDLSPYLPAGVGFMLFGLIVVSGLVALFSSFPSVVGGLQDSAIAILSLATLFILRDMPASATPEQKFYTVTAAAASSSLLTGAALLFLGRFKLGELIRYIPYPVMGGFLAGSGLLLVLGAFGLLINQNMNIWELEVLLEPGLSLIWLPGLV